MEKCKYSGGIVMESEGSLGQCGMPPQLTVSYNSELRSSLVLATTFAQLRSVM